MGGHVVGSLDEVGVLLGQVDAPVPGRVLTDLQKEKNSFHDQNILFFIISDSTLNRKENEKVLID